MSVDLDWNKLDSSLAAHLVDVLNRQLANTTRPSFIGPVEVTSLDFGSLPPDIELVDLRDIYRDFLDEEEEESPSERDPAKVTEGGGASEPRHHDDEDDDDGFEWVSRRTAAAGTRHDDGGLAYHHLPPHVRYGRTPTDLFIPGLASASMGPALRARRPNWMGSTVSLPEIGLADVSRPPPPHFRSPTPSTPFSLPFPVRHHSWTLPNDLPSRPPTKPDSSGTPSSAHAPPPPPQNITPAVQAHPQARPHSPPLPPSPDSNSKPNLQVHLHINWHSNLRITLTTSLLINYPSPMFMSLPIKLSVTGLLFTGELVIAYEGQRNRLHVCILDDLDPYGPATGSSNSDRLRREREFAATIGGSGTPPDLDDDVNLQGSSSLPHRHLKSLPVGQRLLPSIYIESEIGQADKHVLKNVTRVERFIQDVIRTTVEEELVFPNFHTLLMGDNGDT